MSVTVRFGSQIFHGEGFPTVGRGSLVAMPLDTHVRAAVRRCIAEEIERLVDMLDRLDGDADLEPSLGWLCSGGHSYRDGNLDLEVNDHVVGP